MLLRHFGSLYAPARSQAYALLSAADLSFFRSQLPASSVLTHNLEAYSRDVMGVYSGKPSVVLKPESTEQVSALLRYCNERRLAVCPQGGNTGLVGGSVPVHDEVVLSLSRMNRVIRLDADSAVCEAGVVLDELNQACEKRGLMVPLDLGARGSCQLGGNVSTNAAGIRYLRYGSLHASVLGIEAVLASGEVFSSLNTLRKDNTGYDLKQLFIGSEGTLGVVTKVAIALASKPAAVNVAMFTCDDFATVQDLLRQARVHLGEILSAYEFQDREAADLVIKHIPSVQSPFAYLQRFTILIETHGSNNEHDSEKMSNFLESTLSSHPTMQGVMAQDEKQLAALWALRENCVNATSKEGYCFSYDLSLRMSHYYQLVEKTRELVGNLGTVVAYGHIADSNVHLNVSVADRTQVPAVQSLLEPFVYEFTESCGGSISAEHGVGVQKREKLHYTKSPAQLAVMARLKRLLDPHGILSPYKLMWLQA